MVRQRKYSLWLMATAVLIFWFLALDSLVDDSPTMDEQNHIARGLTFLRTGDPRLSLEHPPLVNSLSALPLLTMPELRLPTDQPSWQRQPADVYWYIFAEQLLWDYNRDLGVGRILFLARLPIVFMTLGLALVAFHFARELWSGWASLSVFLLLLFDPNVIANGRYTTTDLGGTFFLLLATYLLWRLWQQPSWAWKRWLWLVVGMGLAFSSKLSVLVFVPIWFLLALLPLYPEGDMNKRRQAGRRLAQLLSAGLASIGVVWLMFGLEWGHFLFQDQRLHGLNSISGPMPTFWAGIEKILTLSSAGRPGFLWGQFSDTGFPLYFPIAFLSKTPILVLLLLTLAIIILLRLRRTRTNALFLLLPCLLFFMVSMQSALNLGYRHLLPLLPLLYLMISGLFGHVVHEWLLSTNKIAHSHSIKQIPTITLAVVVGIALLVVSRIHPHYLSFFNLAVGGPENGHNILLDSNIDWGQDLLRLKQWMVNEDVAEVNLAWFGTAVPDYYGINYQPLPGFPRMPFWGLWTNPPFDPQNPQPGIYAISVSNLWELQLADKHVYPWFRARTPDDRIGYSILIYEVP